MESIKKSKVGGRAEIVFDTVQRKVVIQIDGARGLGKAREYQAVVVNNTSQKTIGKTDYSEKTTQPSFFPSTFFYETADQEIAIELRYSRSFGRTATYGRVFLGKIEEHLACQEKVSDEWLPLEVVDTKQSGSTIPSLRIRMMFSRDFETLPDSPNNHFKFFYNAVLANVKCGDLIFYEGVGIVPTALRVASSGRFSSVALVVELLNKYTEEPQLYLLDVTRNVDQMIDAFSDTVRTGVTLLNLKERLHQFWGRSIYWAPLKKPLNTVQKEQLVSHVLALHSDQNPLNTIIQSNQALNDHRATDVGRALHFLRDRFALDGVKRPQCVAEVFSTALLMGCLEKFLSHPELASVGNFVPDELVSLDAYGELVLLRSRSSDPVASGLVENTASTTPAASSSSDAQTAPVSPKPSLLSKRMSYARKNDPFSVSRSSLGSLPAVETTISDAFSSPDNPVFRKRNLYKFHSLGKWAQRVSVHVANKSQPGRYDFVASVPYFQTNIYDEVNARWVQRQYWFIKGNTIGVQVVAMPIVRSNNADDPTDLQQYSAQYLTPLIPHQGTTESPVNDSVTSVSLSSRALANSWRTPDGDVAYAETVTVDVPRVHRIYSSYQYEDDPNPMRKGFRRASNFAYFDSFGIPDDHPYPKAIQLAEQAWVEGKVPLVQWGDTAEQSSRLFTVSGPNASQLIEEAKQFCLNYIPGCPSNKHQCLRHAVAGTSTAQLMPHSSSTVLSGQTKIHPDNQMS
mmetsp:Transcript_10209/g.15382  ORF Transcript_10209/g.15382 Transcript_10209/m.15382 type:complete len:740 (+) Transcript_10209:26-2245(+)|eukprot:CAMPEP_0201552530 /NCGR_PEP_ID=MMETSP0173_2-20130828/16771_1 /ASSEMBLY_ACC=CAM_ASM_000268 /TAXON_ID=218659 /ORGANISM="Vexillifera sp., Strain DIVA3 564/2" /LENGTH=739 /DNA_ID=CAMNT_0047963031 /DNA_START=25 /DNA_END=2244 /DNA_ORIENTATION=-